MIKFDEDYRVLEKEYEFFHSSHLGYKKNECKELYRILEKNKYYKLTRIEAFEGAFFYGGDFYYFDFLIYYNRHGELIKPTYIKKSKKENSLLKAIVVLPDNCSIGVSGSYNENNDTMIYVIKYNGYYKEFIVSDISNKIQDVNPKYKLNINGLEKLLDGVEDYKTYIGINILNDICELVGIKNIQHEIEDIDSEIEDINCYYIHENDTEDMIYCSEGGKYHDIEEAWMYDGSCD